MSRKPAGRSLPISVTKAKLVEKQFSIFDQSPMTIGGFLLKAREAVPVGKPTIKGTQEALIFAASSYDGAPYWVGDICAYASSREEWREKLSQVMSVTGLSLTTLHNLGYISRSVAAHIRQLSPSPSHTAAVAPLTPAEQVEVLTQASDNGWSAHDTRKVVRAKSRRKIIEGRAVLEGQYRVIYADPPWNYGNRPPSGSGAKDHYPVMTIQQLCALPVAAHTAPDAVLFLWVTAPMLYENPGPREVIEAWGFKPKTGIVWDKVEHNFGNYVSVRHEHLLIATRGKCLPDRPTPMPDSVQTERQLGGHSEKPDSFRALIEKLYDGPYLELFGRARVPGWTVFGNDAALWPEAATHGT